MGYRVQRYRVNRRFIYAWMFLVFTVAVGFWIQAKTIESLHDTQRIQRRLIAGLVEQRVNDIAAVCAITYGLHPGQTEEADMLFKKYEVKCPQS